MKYTNTKKHKPTPRLPAELSKQQLGEITGGYDWRGLWQRFQSAANSIIRNIK